MNEVRIQALMNDTRNRLTAAIVCISLAIDGCEDDKGDERYDALHDIKNRLVTAKKRITNVMRANVAM